MIAELQGIGKWLNENQGIVAVILFLLAAGAGWFLGLFRWLFRKILRQKVEISDVSLPSSVTPSAHPSSQINVESEEKRKKLTNILFVDDERGFNVVQILKNSGWKNTKAKQDLRSLDEKDLVESHICFVDVQGVGKILEFKDEGLGLATAIKRKYPLKKVVIYSAQSEGDRFHEALKIADATLRKDADPYEFQNLVEEFSKKLVF